MAFSPRGKRSSGENEGRTPARPGTVWPTEMASVVDHRGCRYGDLFAFSGDSVIGAALEYYGEWSEQEIDVLSQYIRPGTVALDIGANIGTHSLAFAKRHPDALIWGFEPRPLVNALAWTNCARNGAGNVVIIQAACGEAPGEIVLAPPLASETNVGSFSLIDLLSTARDGVMRENPSGSVAPPFVRVPVVALDLLECPCRISLVKIDVEGAEPAVVAGAKRMLARDNPVVFFETLDTSNLAASVGLLLRLEYRLYWLETHQFNRSNFKNQKENRWSRTEIGILALPPSVTKDPALPRLVELPDTLPYAQNAREGASVVGFLNQPAGGAESPPSQELGYAAAPSLPMSGTLRFHLGSTDLLYLISGFSDPEELGVWTDSEHARISLPLLATPRKFFRARLRFMPFTCEMPPKQLAFVISIGPYRECVSFPASWPMVSKDYCVNLGPDDLESFDFYIVDLNFEFNELESPKDMGLNNDPRKLGIMLLELEYEYG